MDKEREALRRRIEAELDRLDLTPRQAALRAGLSQNVLQQFLSGAKAGLSADTCRALAPVLGWPEAELLRPLGHRTSDPAGDPQVAIRDALAPDRWEPEVRRALLAMVRATDRHEIARRMAAAIDEVLAMPMAARHGEFDPEDYVRVVTRLAIERAFGTEAGTRG